jgi:hypothetical protein
MVEGFVELVGSLGRYEVDPCGSRACELVLDQRAADALTPTSPLDGDHGQVRLDDAIALHLSEAMRYCQTLGRGSLPCWS